MKTPVLIIDTIFAHYRKDFFVELNKSENFEFELITGKEFLGIKSLSNEKNKQFDYLSFKLFGHPFYYLKGVIKYIIKKKAPIIICTGVDFHLIHTIVLFFLCKVILKTKFYWWSHANHGSQGRFGYLIRKFFYRRSNGVLAYSSEGKENLLKMGVLLDNIEVVRNSLNFCDYGYLNYNLDKKKTNQIFTILYSGRITKQKKLDRLVNAVAILKKMNATEVKCVVVGGGEVDNITKLADNLGVTKCFNFVGAKYGTDVHGYFLSADLFIYPGGIGLSVLHALSYGVPVITTNNKTLHFPEFELLSSGYNGDLYNENSVESLAEKIIEWKQIIEQSKNKLSRNCTQKIEELEYLPDKMSKKFETLLKRTNINLVN